MKLILVRTKQDRNNFVEFYKSQYLNNSNKHDSLSIFLKNILNDNSEICRSVDLEPIIVMQRNKIVMVCILAYAYRMKDILQISFLNLLFIHLKDLS